MRNTHTNFQLPASKTDLTYNRSQMGAILPPGTLPWGEGGWGRGVEFPRSASYEGHTYRFSASYLQDSDLSYNFTPWGPSLGGGGGEFKFLDLLHMRIIHTNFQLPTSKTDLSYNHSEMGAILPPWTLPSGELGGG